MKWLQQQAMNYKGIMIGFFCLSLLISFSIVAQSYYIVQTVNEIFINKATFNSVITLLLLLVLCIIARVLFTTYNNFLGVKLSNFVKKSVRQRLLTKWGNNPLQLSIKGQSGSKVTMLVEMIDQLESFYRDYIPQVIKSSVIPVVILVFVFYTHTNSGLILLITAPFIPFSYIITGLQTRKKAERQLVELSTFSGKFLDLLQGLQTLKLFGQGKKQRNALEESNRTFQKSTMELLKIAFASTFFIEIIVTLGIGLVALEIAFQMVTFKTMSFADAFFILALAPEFYNSIKELGGAFHAGRGSVAAAELLQAELDVNEESVSWGKNTLATKPTISIKQGEFSYGGDFALRDLNMKINPGERVAIIGPTGEGKTTLLNILAGIYELKSGEVRIGDEKRCDVDRNEWFKQIAYISQNPYLFAGTIAENIQMNKGAYDKERIREALRLARLDDWFDALEDGIDTLIGEAGRGLSGGEKQRIAIARAFYKNPSIVFFDEPTMGLDVKTEKEIQDSIDVLAQQTTMITVAHRLHTIYRADTIYLLNKGRIESFGTHEELQEKSDHYKRMIGGQPA